MEWFNSSIAPLKDLLDFLYKKSKTNDIHKKQASAMPFRLPSGKISHLKNFIQEPFPLPSFRKKEIKNMPDGQQKNSWIK